MIIHNYKELIYALLIFLVACSHGDKHMSKSVEIEREVNEAFTAIREAGNFSLSTNLYRHGDAVVNYVSPWLSDDNEFVRITAVMNLHAVGSEASAIALVDALSDSSQDVRRRCSRSLYEYLCETNNEINPIVA